MRKPNPKKVVVTPTNSAHIRIFSVRQFISYNVEKYLRRGDLAENPEQLRDALVLAKWLFGIHGVQAVTVDQYDIYVAIGRAFTWKEDGIEQRVISKIREYLATQKMMEDAAGRKMGKDPDVPPDF